MYNYHSGFDKIDFVTTKDRQIREKPSNIINMTAKRKNKSNFKFRFSRRGAVIVLSIVLIVVLLLVGVSIPAYATYQAGLKTYREAKQISAAVKKENVALAAEEIVTTQKDLQDTQNNLHKLVVLKFIPVISWYYNDADHLLNAGAYALDSGKLVADSLLPFADVLGLKGQGSFAMGSASDRIKTAV